MFERVTAWYESSDNLSAGGDGLQGAHPRKARHAIFELLEARVTAIDEVLPDHAVSLITGNCILLAVWHLLPELRAKIAGSLAAAVASNSL